MRTNGTPGISDDLIASYSSKGPSFIDNIAKPDVVAPGNLVISLQSPQDALRNNNPTFATYNSFYTLNARSGSVSTTYFPLSGTSMATGVVSGAVADLIQAAPQLTPDQVKAFIMRDANHNTFPQTSSVTDPTTGIVYNANYDAFTIGAGYLDAYATLKDILSGTTIPSGTAMSPIANYNSKTGTVTLVKRFDGSVGCDCALGRLEHLWFQCLRRQPDGTVGSNGTLGRQRSQCLHRSLGSHRTLGSGNAERRNCPLGSNHPRRTDRSLGSFRRHHLSPVSSTHTNRRSRAS